MHTRSDVRFKFRLFAAFVKHSRTVGARSVSDPDLVVHQFDPSMVS